MGIATLSIFQGQNVAGWVSGRWVGAHQHCIERAIRGDLDRGEAQACVKDGSAIRAPLCAERFKTKLIAFFHTSHNKHRGDLYKYFAVLSHTFKSLLMAVGTLGVAEVDHLLTGCQMCRCLPYTYFFSRFVRSLLLTCPVNQKRTWALWHIRGLWTDNSERFGNITHYCVSHIL